MTEIIISNAPEKYQRHLTIGDAKGNFNQKVDSKQEAKISADELCSEKSAEDCQKFLGYLEKSGYAIHLKTEIFSAQESTLVTEGFICDCMKYAGPGEVEAWEALNEATTMAEADFDKKEVNKAFKKALKISRSIKNPAERSQFLANLASEMIGADLDKGEISKILKKALKAASSIKGSSFIKSNIISNIVSTITDAIFEADFDKNEANKLLKLTLKITYAIKDFKDLEYKSNALGSIVWTMANIGLFKKALKVARTIKSSWNKSETLLHIASEMIGADLDKGEISNILKEALKATDAIDDSLYKSKPLTEIALKIAKAGLDKDETTKLFEEALKVARDFKDLGNKSSALNGIASAMVKAGIDKSEIIKVFKETLKVASTIVDSAKAKTYILLKLAEEMSKAGIDKSEVSEVFKGSLEAAGTINKSSWEKTYTFLQIAKKMFKAGLSKKEVSEALKKSLEAAHTNFIFSLDRTKAVRVLRDTALTMAEVGLDKSEINKMFEEVGLKVPE